MLERECISIKVKSDHGCFCKRHSPTTNRLIDEYMLNNREHNEETSYCEHETGPEIIAWLALGTAGLTLAKALVDMVTAVINACQKGRAKGDDHKGKLLLIVRESRKTKTTTSEVVLEIYDGDVISNDVVKKALETGIARVDRTK